MTCSPLQPGAPHRHVSDGLLVRGARCSFAPEATTSCSARCSFLFSRAAPRLPCGSPLDYNHARAQTLGTRQTRHAGVRAEDLGPRLGRCRRHASAIVARRDGGRTRAADITQAGTSGTRWTRRAGEQAEFGRQGAQAPRQDLAP